MGSSLKISIIVPAFNESSLIAGTLRHIQDSVTSFVRLGWQTELIVCDNNSTDNTADLARQAGAIVAYEPINQIGRARNTGAAAATGDWLIFVDADSTPSTELFADVAEQIQSGRCIAGGSTVRLDGDYARLIAVWNLLSRATKWAAGSFIYCEAAAFREIGGFSNELFASEEIDLSKRLKKLAREQGKTFVILSRHPLLTSARKMKLYSRGDYLRFFVRYVSSGGQTLKSRDECFPWYDGRR